MNHAQYDQKKIDALASELMEPQRLANGGPPSRSKLGRVTAAIRAAGSPTNDVAAIDSASGTVNLPAQIAEPVETGNESFRLYHGTPHVFGASQRVRNRVTGKEYVSDPKMVESVMAMMPDQYEVIGENPLGMFDINRIGTGEGAQAYGFGAYGTQVPDVGRGYRQTLLRRHDIPDTPQIGGQAIQDVYSQIERRAARLPIEQARKEYDKLAIIEQMIIDGDILGVKQGRSDYDPEAYKWFEQSIAPKYTRPGALYEMQVNAPQSMFLDWDKPIADQTPEVQASLQAAGIYDPSLEQRIALLQNEKQMISLDRDPVTNVMRDERRWHDLSNEIDQLRKRQPANMTGRQAYYLSAADATSQAEASEALKGAGIPGIQYLDQASRGDGDGTRNFVIFDPKMIEILEKYGLAGATTGAAMLGAESMSKNEEPEGFAGGGAIRKAAEAVRQAADSDLDMSTEARMQRAAEQRFTENVYHTSRNADDITSFHKGDDAVSPFDAIGVHAGTQKAANHRYESANKYRHEEDKKGATYPLIINKDRLFLSPDGGPWEEEALSEFLNNYQFTQPEGLRGSKDSLRQSIWSKYDAIPYINDVEDAGSISYIVPPQNIRSVNAAFDPAKRESSNILSGLGAAAIGAGALTSEEEPEGMSKGGAIRKAAEAVRAAGRELDLPIVESTDDPYDVMNSHFDYGQLVGNQKVKIEELIGGVRSNDSAEAKRVSDLANKISDQTGYISRLIVDSEGNVLEGQHRLEALKMLGAKTVPVTMVKDLSKEFNVPEMVSALDSFRLHPDQKRQMVLRAIEAIQDAGSVDMAISEYRMPAGLQEAFVAALRAAESSGSLPTGDASDVLKLSKGGKVEALSDMAKRYMGNISEAGNVYKAAVGNMFSPWEPVEPQLGDPNDYEFPELRLRRPGIVNLAVGMPNMFADMRDLFGAVKDVAIGDEVPDEQWARWDKATEAQGRYEEDMDTWLRHYTGKSVDELSGPMSAVLGLSEAAAQPGIISAKVVAGLPSLARYLSHLAEFATPVTVASPGAMLTGATVNAGIRALPALMEGDDLEQMNSRYSNQDITGESGRDLTGREQARLDKYLQELLGKKNGGLVYDANRINALANELMEPVRLSEGGPPPRSKIARAAAAVRGAATPPREIPDEQRVSEDDFARIARDLGIDPYETSVLTDMPMPSITQYTAADRAAAGRRAASLISTQHPIKASEALGRLMEQGFRRTATTQADRTIVGDGNIGGPNFPVLGMVDPEYAGRSWGVMTKGPATTLIRQSSPETAWTTMLGSADQLRSNQLVFDDLRDAFVSSMRQGNLTPDLESRFNHNLRLILGEDANVRDPDIWSRANTFAKRGEVAKLMMGIGISPKKGGVPLGGERSGKGVIFNPSEILKRQTEPSLLHPTQGGTVPTYALGPRMFTIEDSADYRPDLHPGFPMLLKGRDLGLNVIPTPTEIYLPDWHRNFREVMGGRTPPRKAPPGRYDLASGLQGQGLPAQDLTDDYIRHLIREGFAKGGLANYRDMIRSN
jgi:hypothetical protein